MRWLKITIMTLGGMLAACAVLLVSILLFVGHSDLSGVITRGVHMLTDHSIELDGPVTLELSTSPTLNASGIRFRMQDESVELQADDLRLQVDIPSLADGHLLIREFGTHNTTVTVRLPAYDTQDEEGELDIELGAMTFNRIDIENLAVDVFQPHEIEPLHLKLDTLQAQRNELGVLSPITARGSVDGEPFTLDGSVARGEAATAADRSFIVDLHAEVLESSLHASGELAGDGGAAPTGDLSVQIEIPDVQAVLRLFHIGVPALGALTATGNLTGTLNALQLEELVASLAKEDVMLSIHGAVDNLSTASGVDLSYDLDITDASLLAWLLPDQLPQFHTVRTTGDVTGDAGQLKLVAEKIEARDARGHELEASGKTLILGEAPFVDDLEVAVSAAVPNLDYVRQFSEAVPKLGPVMATANISMNGGVLAIQDIKATSTAGDKGKVYAEGAIGHISFTPVDVSQMDFTARVENVTAQQIADAVDIKLPTISSVNAQAKYSGSDKQSVVSDLQLQAGHPGKLKLDASGDIRIGDMRGSKPLAGLTLDIAMQAPNSAELGVLTGGDIPALGFFRAEANIRETNGLIGITALDASLKRGNDFSAQLTGTMEDLFKLAGINMRLDMTAVDLMALGKLFDTELPQEGAVRMSGNIRGNREQLRYNGHTNLRNTTWSTDLTGAFAGKRPRIAGTIEVPVLDIHDVGLYPERLAQQAETEAALEEADDKPKETVPLFSNEPFDVTWLRSVDLDIKASIDRLASTDASIEDIFTHVLLNDGKLEIQPLRYSVDGDLVTAGLTIDAKSDVPSIELQLEGTEVDLGLLLTNSPEQPAPIRGIMTAKAFLHTRGATQAQRAANLTGSINVVTENARVRKSLIALLNIDVLGWVLSNVVSLEKDMQVGCAIFSVTFDKGMGETELFIIDTPDTLIRVNANANFHDETMYVAILPERKVRLLGKRKPMEIHGPITNPEYKLVSLKDLTLETSAATLLAPLTITGTILGNIATLVGATPEPEGTCDQFINQ